MKNLFGLHLTAILLLVFETIDQVDCGRVLIVALVPLFSHQIVFYKIATALHKRGHEIVIVTPDPKRNSTLTNYTEIDFSIAYEVIRKSRLQKNLLMFQSLSLLDIYASLYEAMDDLGTEFYKHPEVQKLYTPSIKKFDVVIIEGLIGYATMAIAHKLNAPLIGLISTPPHIYHHYTIGSPLLSTHESNWEFYATTGKSMPFWTRLKNFILMYRVLRQWICDYMPNQQSIARKALGDDIPWVLDIAKNMSLLLLSYEPVVEPARPLPSSVIPIGNFHILEKPPPLPKELEEFLGNATNGFVYMSLGSNIKSSMMSPEQVMALYNAFSRLPYRVLWKFEADYLPREKSNVLTSKWIPQQSVLAHPNIKLFIFQGGLQSAEETIHYGVPIIGIPVIFEQMYRIQRLVSLGAGRSLTFAKIDEETFFETISDVLNDKRYKMNMVRLQKLVKDKPYDMREHALWWIEYVMRHKSAKHLRFDEIDYYSWYQRYDMDIVAFLSIILFVLAVISVAILVQSMQWIYKYSVLVTERNAPSKKDEKFE